MPIERADLVCVLDPFASAAPSRGILTKIPAADRSGRGVARDVDGASRRISQWRKRARLTTTSLLRWRPPKQRSLETEKPKRRVPVTASNAWPDSSFDEERSPNRWQHRLKREHPSGTERTKTAPRR